MRTRPSTVSTISAVRTLPLARRLPPERPTKFLVTDDRLTFIRVGTRLLGEAIQDVESIELEHRLELAEPAEVARRAQVS